MRSEPTVKKAQIARCEYGQGCPLLELAISGRTIVGEVVEGEIRLYESAHRSLLAFGTEFEFGINIQVRT